MYVYLGHCDTDVGICTCFTGFASSDGKGGAGSRGDCGYYEDFAIYSIVPTCPLYNNEQCGGSTRGVCNNATGIYVHTDSYLYMYIYSLICVSIGACSCLSGYTGGDCSKLSCPSSTAWFGSSITLNNDGDRTGR